MNCSHCEEIEVEEKDKEGNTKKIAEQKAVSYGYTIHCSDGTTQKPIINRESENIIKDLIENFQEDLDVIKDKLCDPVPCEKMMPKLWRKYQMANKCWGCEENYIKLDIIKFVYSILKLKNTWVLHIENVTEKSQ